MTALHPEQRGALRRPVARRAGAVLLAGEHHQRGARLLVVLRGLEDRRHLAVVLGEVARARRPRCPGRSWLRSRMLAKVPRIITSWLPRREP